MTKLQGAIRALENSSVEHKAELERLLMVFDMLRTDKYMLEEHLRMFGEVIAALSAEILEGRQSQDIIKAVRRLDDNYLLNSKSNTVLLGKILLGIWPKEQEKEHG